MGFNSVPFLLFNLKRLKTMEAIGFLFIQRAQISNFAA